MTHRMTESYVTGYLDRMGALDAARGPGVYAVRLVDPGSDASAIERNWLEAFTAPPPAGFCDRVAAARRLCYVGSHGKSVYQRLCEHARGHKSSAIMEVWPPVDVAAIWPCEDGETPRDEEWNYANELADGRTAVWCDGELL